MDEWMKWVCFEKASSKHICAAMMMTMTVKRGDNQAIRPPFLWPRREKGEGRREREKWKGGSLKNYMLLNWNFRLKAEAKHETGRGYRNIETTSQDTNSRMVVYYYLWLYYSGHWPRAIFSLFRTIFTHNLPRLINKWIAITHCVYAALLSAPLFANALCQFILEKF